MAHSSLQALFELFLSVLFETQGAGAIDDYIKNVVSSSYSDPYADFKKTTYISSVAIYDENKNLIGIAKLATPVKKTEDLEYTIKMKLDI